MGSGKTEIARALARQLDLPMIDLDEVITARTAKTPAQLISEDGESVFRKVETKALEWVLGTTRSAVIALGGGAWIEGENRELIKEAKGQSIFLDVPFEICWSRIEASVEDRPLGKTREEARKRFELRRPIYQLADIHAPVNLNDTPSQIADQLSTQF